MRVPLQSGPSVEPVAVPLPQQSISSPPSAFGGLVGAAEQGLGADLDKASANFTNMAIQKQELLNKVASDDGFNKFQDASNKLLYGDPNNPNQPGYYSLHGEAAVNARAGLVQQLETMRQGIKGTMPNQMTQLGFDEASRRLNMYSMQGIGSHAETEYNRYAAETYKAGVSIASQDVANNHNDEDKFQQNVATQTARARNNAIVQFGADPNSANGQALIQAEQDKVSRELYKSRAVAMGNANPSAGEAYVRQNIDKFDAVTGHTLLGEFKAGADRASVAAGVQSVTGGPPSAIITPRGIGAAIDGVEGKGVSVQGAVDGVMPATFKQYAKPGEDIGNQGDRAAVKQRIIADLSQRFNGDPKRIAVGFFSGPGNVAPPGADTPWIEDKKDGNGTSTSSYVAQVTARMGAQGQAGAGPSAGVSPPSIHTPMAYAAEQTMMEDARTEAEARFPNRPDLQHQMVSAVYDHIQQTNVLQAKFEAETAKQQRDAQEQAGQTVVRSLMTDPAKFDPAVIRDNPALSYTQKEALWKLAESHLAQGANNHDTTTYGAGFYDAFSKVHAAANDPARISDPSQLWSHVGPSGDLTVAGVDKLTSEIQGSRSVEGANEGAMKKAFFDAAHVQISQHGLGMNGRDPIGEQKFAQFQVAALTAYDEGRKSGLTPQQLLSEKSPGYIGHLMPQFMRTNAQKMADFFSANNPEVAATPGVIPGKTTPSYSRVDLEAEMRRRGLLGASAPSGPQVPH